MFARSTTVQAQPESIDDGIAHLRDTVLPQLQEIDGFIGLSLLVDRESGRCIAASAWQSEDAMRASADQLRTVRERAAEIFGGSLQIDEWEIAVLHRDHTSRPGAWVRATWVRGDPARLDQAIDVYKMALLPALEEFDGFCSASLLVNRGSGLGVSSVTFDSREALDGSRDRGTTLRESISRDAGVEVMEVREFELALAHLRVPELA
ncbi:hypothetical protein [Pseudonocardia asaccharolytica]|uniref:hypothetical protein n=1 Tax=Pseudonocardia asaccharolytica TaxID=54010 RepID=UPI00040DFE1B|nr:hypothetical protein [Pseudonocardia asaccharolytica]